MCAVSGSLNSGRRFNNSSSFPISINASTVNAAIRLSATKPSNRKGDQPSDWGGAVQIRFNFKADVNNNNIPINNSL